MSKDEVSTQLAELDKRSSDLGTHMSPMELAHRLSCHRITIYKRLNNQATDGFDPKKINAVRVGKNWKIPLDEVRRIMENGV